LNSVIIIDCLDRRVVGERGKFIEVVMGGGLGGNVIVLSYLRGILWDGVGSRASS
jgi:hypothetical protein